MSDTILETLQSADVNINSFDWAGASVGIKKLHTATVLLTKGYDPHDEVQPLIEGYETVEDVPIYRGNLKWPYQVKD